VIDVPGDYLGRSDHVPFRGAIDYFRLTNLKENANSV
jgi:hypothetical protein